MITLRLFARAKKHHSDREVIVSMSMSERATRPTRLHISTAMSRAPLACGDAVDWFDVGDGCTWVCVVDVCGRGPLLATASARLCSLVRASAHVGARPADALNVLNREMCREPAQFAAVFVAALGNRRLSYASAGHGVALLLRERAHEHLGPTGMLAGVEHDQTYDQVGRAFEAGSVLVVATDGISEARRRGSDDWFGSWRIDRSCRKALARGIAEPAAAILNDVREFVGELDDDAAVVTVAA